MYVPRPCMKWTLKELKHQKKQLHTNAELFMKSCYAHKYQMQP
jgi:hypothetical protein